MQSPTSKLDILRYVLRTYPLATATALTAVLLEATASLLQPWPLKFVIDSTLGDHPLPSWLTGPTELVFGEGKLAILSFAVAAAVAIALVSAVTSYVDSFLTRSIGIWFSRDLRQMIFQRFSHLSPSYYDRHSTGSLISTMTTDVNAIRAFVSTALLGILVDVFTFLGMVVVMLHLEWEYTLIALIVMPGVMLYVSRLMSAVKEATRATRREQSELVSIEEETATSMLAIQAFGREDFEAERFQEKNIEATVAATSARRLKALVAPSVELVIALGTAAVLWFGARRVLGGSGTVGDLVVFLAYLARMFKPVQDLSKMSNVIAQAWVGFDRVREVLEAQSGVMERPDALRLERSGGRIEFDRVTFGYEADEAVLRGVSFEIRPGSQVGLVGPSGHGKSTIVELIARLYDPVAGSVRLDGHDLRDLTLHSLREQLGMVLQDSFLFHDTVLENIRLGRLEATREEVVAAAKAAGAHGFIERMPHGYDSVIGERGATLSGGERQRLSIARAVLRNAPIWILDEPTAALDANTEEQLMENLRPLVRGRTCIVIAHRLVTVRDSDWILVVKDGGIAEQGTPRELLERGGEFARLHRQQTGS